MADIQRQISDLLKMGQEHVWLDQADVALVNKWLIDRNLIEIRSYLLNLLADKAATLAIGGHRNEGLGELESAINNLSDGPELNAERFRLRDENKVKIFLAINALKERVGLYKDEKVKEKSEKKIAQANDILANLSALEADLKTEFAIGTYFTRVELNEKFEKIITETGSPTLNGEVSGVLGLKAIYLQNMNSKVAWSADERIELLHHTQNKSLKRIIDSISLAGYRNLDSDVLVNIYAEKIASTFFADPHIYKGDFSSILDAIEKLSTPPDTELLKLVIKNTIDYALNPQNKILDNESRDVLLDICLLYAAKTDVVFCAECFAKLPKDFNYINGAKFIAGWLHVNQYTPVGERLFISYLYQFLTHNLNPKNTFESFFIPFKVKSEEIPADIAAKLYTHIIELTQLQKSTTGRLAILDESLQGHVYEFFNRPENKQFLYRLERARLKTQLEANGCNSDLLDACMPLDLSKGDYNKYSLNIIALITEIQTKKIDPTQKANMIYNLECLSYKLFPDKKQDSTELFQNELFAVRKDIDPTIKFNNIVDAIVQIRLYVFMYKGDKASVFTWSGSPTPKEKLAQVIHDKLERLENQILNGNYKNEKQIEKDLDAIITNTGSPTLDGNKSDVPSLREKYNQYKAAVSVPLAAEASALTNKK